MLHVPRFSGGLPPRRQGISRQEEPRERFAPGTCRFDAARAWSTSRRGGWLGISSHCRGRPCPTFQPNKHADFGYRPHVLWTIFTNIMRCFCQFRRRFIAIASKCYESYPLHFHACSGILKTVMRQQPLNVSFFLNLLHLGLSRLARGGFVPPKRS